MDDENKALFIRCQQRALLTSETPQIVGTATLQKMQITGVVDETGKIRVLVVNALHQSMAVLDKFARKRDGKGHGVSLGLPVAPEHPSRTIRCSLRLGKASIRCATNAGLGSFFVSADELAGNQRNSISMPSITR